MFGHKDISRETRNVLSIWIISALTHMKTARVRVRNGVSVCIFTAMAFLVGLSLLSHPGRPGRITPLSVVPGPAAPPSTAPRPEWRSTPAVGTESLEGVTSTGEIRSPEGAGQAAGVRKADDIAAAGGVRPMEDVTPEPIQSVGSAFTTGAIRSTDRTPSPDGPTPSVPVLSYHYLRAETTPLQFAKILGALFLNLPLLGDMDVWTQTVSSFDRQMAYLKAQGFESVDLADLFDWQRGRVELPRKPVVITFDDGDRSVLEYAYPILERYGFRATLFVVTSRVGEAWDGVDCLDWGELEMLEQSGVFSIQSHTHDLHRKVKTSEGTMPVFVAANEGLYMPAEGFSWTSMVSEDLRTSRELIEKHVGGEVRFLAWPYGFGSAPLDSIAVEAGFHGLCTLEPARNKRLGADDRASYPSPTLAGVGFLRAASALASTPGDQSAPKLTSGVRGRWTQFEIKRFTITARTSIRSFKEMLEE